MESGRDDGGLLLLLRLLLMQVRLPDSGDDDSGLLPSFSPRDSVHVNVKDPSVPSSSSGFADSSVCQILLRFLVDLSSQRRRLEATNVIRFNENNAMQIYSDL